MGGEKVETFFHPSNVRIVVLNLDDARRFKRKKVGSGEGKNGSRMNANERELGDKKKSKGKVIKAKSMEKKDAYKEN